MKIFTGSIVAFRSPTLIRHYAIAISARDEEDAEAQAERRMNELVPSSEGFTNQDYQVGEVPGSWYVEK